MQTLFSCSIKSGASTNPVQLFLLVLLERLCGYLGASLTALRELWETSSAQETLCFGEFGPARETSSLN